MNDQLIDGIIYQQLVRRISMIQKASSNVESKRV